MIIICTICNSHFQFYFIIISLHLLFHDIMNLTNGSETTSNPNPNTEGYDYLLNRQNRQLESEFQPAKYYYLTQHNEYQIIFKTLMNTNSQFIFEQCKKDKNQKK